MTARPANATKPIGAVLREAWGNLMQLRQRSVLALLGILIGTGSVIAMLSIGRMAGQEALKPFAAMGVDLLLVQQTNSAGGLSLSEIESLPRRVAGVTAAAPFATGQEAPTGDLSHPPPGILATTPQLLALCGLKLAQGRWLTQADGDSLVALVGGEVAGPSSPAMKLGIGDEVRAGHYLYRVVGVLAPSPKNILDPTDFNRAIIIPLASAQRSLNRTEPTGALIQMGRDTDEARLTQALRGALQPGGGDSQIQVQGARQVVAAVKAQRAVQTRMLAALAGVSLLVGGLGVMNVMLMAMMERRREIGLRVAVGATPADIRSLFLAEAAMLAAAGGALGVGLGIVSAGIAATISHWEFSVAWYSLPLGVGIALVFGLVFGLYPAIKAARLDPIEALRAE